jgi:hypothetical protein
LNNTKKSPTPIQIDPATPRIFGISPYLIMLIAYPVNTVEKLTADTFPDFLLANMLATTSPVPTNIGRPTFRITSIFNVIVSGVGFGTMNRPKALYIISINPRCILACKALVCLSSLVRTTA